MAPFKRAGLATAIAAIVAAPSVSAEVLEEVVVTAQKREQSVQDVGISVTAFTGEQLSQLGYTNAQEVTALAPGVSTIQPNGPANYAVAIRGVAQNDFISNQESPVSIYIDDVYLSQMSSAGFMLFDMDRVEILRGPQGTLYGRNATGGLVHYVSRKPTAERDGYAQLTGGYYDQVKFEGAYGGALSDNVFGRVSVATHHNDGYVDNRVLGEDINNANDYAGRIQLLFQINEDLDFLFNARGSISQIRTGFFENVTGGFDPVTGAGFNTPGVPNAYNGYVDNDGDPWAGDYNYFGHQDIETWGFSGTFNWDLRDDLKLMSITDYQTVKRDYMEDSDASPFSDFNFFQATDADQFSQEFRLIGTEDQFRWMTGFFFLHINVNDANGAQTPLMTTFTNPLFGGLPGPLIDAPTGAFGAIEGDGSFFGNDNPYHTITNSWSLFGQMEYDFNEQWTGIAGLRYIDEHKNHTFHNNFVDFQWGTKWRNGNPNILQNLGTYTGNYDKGLWAAKVELDFKPTDDALLYASWNRGVKGGGFNAPLDVTDYFGIFGNTGLIPLTDNLMKFKEEKLDAFEGGFKLSLFGGLARLNGSGYYYDYKDYQAFQIIGLTTFIFNADAKSHGGELEFQASPMEGLDFLAGVAYNDVTIKNVDLDGAGPGGASDTKPVQSPKWNINALLRYQWPFWQGNLAVQGDFQYRSKHFFSLTRAPASTQTGYAIGNARLSYQTADKQWEAAVFVNNIADEEYLVQTFDLAAILGMNEQFYGLPRWVGGSVRFNF
ncbi:MAG: TonB-dependent receptor [Gammaproteobacteria bacterium]|nr:TonB-dependent receptor [Gammaproteobacteria bacterium]